MRSNILLKSTLAFLVVIASLIPVNFVVFAKDINKYVYDFANLLTDEEATTISKLAKDFSVERETDFVILTTNETDGRDVVQYMQDFYDEKGLGYNKQHGNTAILTIDMQHREIYLAGFYKGKEYLDDRRLDTIRNKITPFLSDGDYFNASKLFIELAHEYMGFRPGINPNSLLFKWQFQLIVSLVVGILAVTLMLYRTGGRVTVNSQTYMNDNTSRVVRRNDKYLRTSVTKVKKPSSNNTSGGGGGITGGGHSHSGSRGSF